MDAPQWNGDDTRPLGRSDGTPTIYRCLTCGWKGKGMIARIHHVDRSGHRLIVPKGDPRFDQPKAESEVA